MSEAINKFAKFESLGSKALELMRKKAFSPQEEKLLRTWTITETAGIIGKSTQTIREHQKNNPELMPQTASDSNKKLYSLKDINKLRIHFGCAPRKPLSHPPSIIAFTNFKGGVAKTTSAVHAAHYFAKSGYRVLLIDTDSQASATASFGYAPDEHIKKEETLLPFFLGNTETIKACIRKTYWENLDLIPSNLALYGIELEIPALKERSLRTGYDIKIHNILDNGLKQIYNSYDIIIIDCPPSLSILNTNALYAANAIVVPCPPEVPDIASMFQFFGMIKGTLQRFPEKEFSFVRILITKHDGSKSSNGITAVLRKLYGGHVMHSEMFNTQVIKKARSEMKSIYETTKYSGSKQTLNRAVQLVDSVNHELEEYILECWNEELNVKQNELIEESV